ncbi:MAG: alanine dehydrogenase [Pseudomonadales bacterium]|nr:alanine dehydrogenase [Pseudomonadales bacterium]MBO6595164.1 alanine dehydrogenase [Pseudomonadales bacterium]MBO6656197.1 alanine dehydrogenase [Pseudomonadales bacterium]MBO6701670.1 alanine dehydrogenase [Pseudomonadales bacterium]MBO6821277.1 alanine dehydrogenase [Pseudomonadales bacterium]
MLVGVPKEIKNHEYRVGLLPSGVRELIHHGHAVVVEDNAGAQIGFDNDSYRKVGAEIVSTAEKVFERSDMIVKVKEPQAVERRMLNESQTLFTYLHLAPDLPQTKDLLDSGATCIAYETVTDARGRLPLLAPMSEVAGRMSVQAGAMCLEKSHGGSGILLGGVPGTHQGRVLILGGGVVGQNAAQMAIGLGANVTIIDKSLDVLRDIDVRFGNRVQTLYSTQDAIAEEAMAADLIIGAVLVPGASAPKLITRALVAQMKKGSVMVDVAIDQGGCFETSKPTTHDDPTYLVDDVVHYCVANMPGAVARTSAAALNNATLPFVLELADKGAEAAMRNNPHLLHGLNVYHGHITNAQVGEAHGMEFVEPEILLAA